MTWSLWHCAINSSYSTVGTGHRDRAAIPQLLTSSKGSGAVLFNHQVNTVGIGISPRTYRTSDKIVVILVNVNRSNRSLSYSYLSCASSSNNLSIRIYTLT